MKRITALIVLLLAFCWIVAGQAREPEPPERYSLHLVQPGDTLWSISRQYMPDTDPRLGVEWISQANGLQGAIIRPGDILNVPHESGPLAEPLGPEYSSPEAAEMAESEFQRLFSR